MSFASRLDRTIKERRLSSQAVADRLTDMGREGVRSWRKGHTQPTVDYIVDLATILDVEPEWLLTGREVEPGTLAEDEAFVLEAFRTARTKGLTAADVVLLIGGAVDRAVAGLRGQAEVMPDPERRGRQSG
jgi:transcriptional regulator with XRE-family HTH domain